MSKVILNTQLASDSEFLGSFDTTAVLLMKNASYPWLVLVPNTEETELHLLAPEQQQRLMRQANLLAEFITQWKPVDKINMASIGNVVSQLHFHVVGRSRSDPSWPGVVWGASAFKNYECAEVDAARRELAAFAKDNQGELDVFSVC